MTFSKNDIIQALRHISVPGGAQNMVDSGAVQNITVFDQEVVVDVLISNPTLQARKKTEVEIIKVIHEKVYEKIHVQVNVRVSEQEPPKEIKGKKIDGIASIIAIASGKGGVGKSTIASNLAVSLSKMGFKVGFLDADIYGPSAPIMFDVEGQRPLAVNVNGASKMKPVENYGVKILSIGFFASTDQAMVWRGPMASKALNQMIFDADWGELDFLILDLPPGTGDIHLSIVQALPITGVVVVSTPQNIALADARKGVSMFQQQAINVPVLGIVENMAYFSPEELPGSKYYIFGQHGASRLAERIGVPLLGEIPLVQSIREASDIGRPAALQSQGPTQEAFLEMTKNILTQLIERNNDLPPTEVVRITNMSGCSAAKKPRV